MTDGAARSASGPRLDDQLIATVTRRLEANQRVRRTLPDGGRVNIDRQLPFLIVHRPQPDGRDDGIHEFVRGEASYLVAPRHRRHRAKTRELGTTIVRTLSDVFGGFLVIELWAGPPAAPSTPDGQPPPPAFRVIAPRAFAHSPGVDELVASLKRVELYKRRAQVELVVGGRLAPRDHAPLATVGEMRAANACVLGVEIAPVYLDPTTGDAYPIALRHLARRVSRALRQACFEFARRETNARPRHYQSLGTRAFNRAAWDIDAALAAIARSFDVLLYVTPTNAAAAFRAFKSSRFERVPELYYRPRDVDLSAVKRRLHSIDPERVDDPTLAHLFREKKAELDLQLSLLLERENRRFLPLSVALHGRVDDDLVATAEALLHALPPGGKAERRGVRADVFAQRAREELEGYRRAYPPFRTEVHLRDELTSLMVTDGQLLVGRHMTFPPERVEPLIQHEVGTHIVTHQNGSAQPLELLAVGLANYEELQEGLAVFAEYLAAGLTPQRMRTLAGRVVGARLLVDGAEFVETFRALRDRYGFGERAAWQITMRLYRGGGYVKDSIYLRGLQSVLDHLAAGGHLETLLIGKVAAEHAPIIEELQRRRVLNPAPLRPAYLDDPDGQRRLDRARQGLQLLDLVERR